MVICKICNREFIHNSALSRHLSQNHKIKYYDYLINYLHIEHPLCTICNKEKVRYHKMKFSKYCSFKCSVIGNSQSKELNLKRSNSLKKFNKENPEVRQEVQLKLKEMYKDENQRKKVSDAVKKAWNNKSIEEKEHQLRGYRNPETIKKRTNTLRKLYENNNELKERISKSVKEAYEIMDEETKKIIFDAANTPEVYKKRANTLKKKWENFTLEEKGKMLEKMKGGYESNPEKELKTFIKNLNVEIISRYKKLGIELDIYLPKHNIAIEFNGLVWHSENFGGKDRKYHLNKTIICEKNNIRLIHIFEDEWINKKEIILNKLKNILKVSSGKRIYARKCNVKILDNNIKNEFLETYHIQGKCTCKINYGLYYNDELVSVMTFSKGRISLGSKTKEDEYELVRYATNFNYNVIGGASKLLNQFIKKYNPIKIYSYADRRYSVDNNNLYNKIGFKLDKITQPNYYYLEKYKKRLHRFNFTKKKLITMGADSSLTEWEIMKKLKYDRIWDCGHYKYIMEF